jgi:Uma2 family endonuclease
MSYEEFLFWANEDTQAEWVDGEVIEFMPAKPVHQSIAYFLVHLLGYFNDLFQLGQIRFAPLEMRLRGGRSSREPDILFIKQANLHRLNETRLEGPADLVIEIVSDDSVTRDRRDKLKEYQEAGIAEYWIIDPRPGKLRADFYRLNEVGQYELFGLDEDERVESAVLPGFWLRPQWLWQVDTLNPLHVFAEIVGLPDNFMAQMRQASEQKEAAQGDEKPI